MSLWNVTASAIKDVISAVTLTTKSATVGLNVLHTHVESFEQNYNVTHKKNSQSSLIEASKECQERRKEALSLFKTQEDLDMYREMFSDNPELLSIVPETLTLPKD